MKNIVAMSAAIIALTVSISAEAKDQIEKSLDLRGFNRIEIAGVYQLDVTVGEEFSILLSGAEKEMDRVEVSVRGDALRLGTRDRQKGEKRFRDRDGVKAVVTLPALEAIDVSGVVEAEARGIDAESFSVDLSGVGEIELSGKCGHLDANVSGVGELNAEALKCRDAEVQVSGVGEASVYASDSVDAKVSGIGEIDVYGSPKNVTQKAGLFADISIH